jgi:hypothetical protein
MNFGRPGDVFLSLIKNGLADYCTAQDAQEMTAAQRTAWTITTLPGGSASTSADYTDAAGIFSFSVLAASLHMSEADVLRHVLSDWRPVIAGYLRTDGPAFTALVEQYHHIGERGLPTRRPTAQEIDEITRPLGGLKPRG